MFAFTGCKAGNNKTRRHSLRVLSFLLCFGAVPALWDGVSAGRGIQKGFERGLSVTARGRTASSFDATRTAIRPFETKRAMRVTMARAPVSLGLNSVPNLTSQDCVVNENRNPDMKK